MTKDRRMLYTVTTCCAILIGCIPESGWMAEPVVRQNQSAVAQQSPPEWFGATIRPTDPKTPTEEWNSFHVEDGLAIQLVASEPIISKPMNLAFDPKGRLWMTQSIEYPFPNKNPSQARDSIVILEDQNFDGMHETATIFAEGLNVPIGLLPYRDGVLCFSIPDILWLRDTDGDGRCDQRQKILGPFDTSRDTHGMVNSMRRGLDGWIYACHGFNNQSKVSGTDGHEVSLTSGNVFRFRPDGSRVELYTQGQVNPFGMAEDDWGNFYSADCHSKPISQLIRGGCYPSFGRAHDGLGFIPPTMDHLHGSTAIAGLAIGQGDRLGYKGATCFLSGNVMTCRINRNELVRRGATVIARELPDLLSCDDPWFRPVDLTFGPDGYLYIADFYNKIIGHYEVPLDHPGRDRIRGRVWRIGPQDAPNSPKVDLDFSSPLQAIQKLNSSNPTVRRLALDTLSDRFPNSTTLINETLSNPSNSDWTRIGCLWAWVRIHQSLPINWESLLEDSSPLVRNHAALAASSIRGPNFAQSLRKIIDTPIHTGSGNQEAWVVLRSAVEALGQHGDASDVLRLLSLASATGDDPILAFSIRIAVRTLVSDPSIQNQLLSTWKKGISDVNITNPAANSIDLKNPLARPLALILTALPTNRLPRSALLAWLTENEVPADIAGEMLPRLLDSTNADEQAQIISLAERYFSNHPRDMKDILLRLAASEKSLRGTVSPELQKFCSATMDQWIAAWNETEHQHPLMTWYRSDKKGEINEAWPMETRRSTLATSDSVQVFSSLPLGESYVGTTKTSNFVAPRRLSFDLCGHNGKPDKASHDLNQVILRDVETGKVIRQAMPPRNDRTATIEWDLSDSVGRLVRLECIDRDSGSAYAWLAVGNFSISGLNASTYRDTIHHIVELSKALSITNPPPETLKLNHPTRMDFAYRAKFANVFLMHHDPLLASCMDFVQKEQWCNELLIKAEYWNSIPWQTPNRSTEMVDVLVKSVGMFGTAAEQQRLTDSLLNHARGWEYVANAILNGKISKASLAGRDKSWWDALPNTPIAQQLRSFRPQLEKSSLVSLGELQARVEKISKLEANLKNGMTVFKKHCSLCHQLSGQGTVLGPQLDGVHARGTSRLAEDILLPNQNVDHAFRVTTYLLDNGQVVTGLIRQQNDVSVQLVNSKGEPIVVLKAEVVQEKQGDVSLMPDNFSQSLTDSEIADLISYLRTPSPAVTVP